MDLPLANIEIDSGEGLDAAEGFVDALELKKGWGLRGIHNRRQVLLETDRLPFLLFETDQTKILAEDEGSFHQIPI